MVFRKRSSKRRISAKHVTVCYLVVLIPLLLMPTLLFYNGYTFLDTETPSFPRHINKTLQQAQLQSPEPLEKVQFCAEKCRYVKEMCTTNKYRDTLQLPAPTCLTYSQTPEEDIYWASLQTKDQKLNKERNEKTLELVQWAAVRARERRGEGQENSHFKCEEAPSSHTEPMMFPEEFEFIVKLFANAKPTTYLEWGTGTSTSFYPLLASGSVYAIDGYPPWCQKVMSEPRIHCMTNDEKRMHFMCPELYGADGVTKVELKETGRIEASTAQKDVEAAMSIYVNSIDKLSVTTLDIALVDGRFRIQCALKLLPYLTNDSVLILHDFWIRKPYHKVLEYYYVIGYARSVVALRKKGGLSEEQEKNVYQHYMKYNEIPWMELM